MTKNKMDWRENTLKKLQKIIYNNQCIDPGVWASKLGCSYEEIHEQLTTNVVFREAVEQAIDRLIFKLGQAWLDSTKDKDSEINPAQTKAFIAWLKKKEYLPDLLEASEGDDNFEDLFRVE